MIEVNGSAYALSVLGPARRIEWEGDFPADLRAIVEPIAAPLEILVPTWCQTLSFRFCPHEENTLKIEISLRNRWALIRICPSWFACSAVEREGSMIHELCHALIEPLHWTTKRALEAHGPEEGSPARTLLDQVISDGLEQAVEDMARAFHKVLRMNSA